MPAHHADDLAARGEDVVVLCANVRDEVDVIVDYWMEKDFTMTPVRMSAKEAAQSLGVKGFPSNIVIGPDGKVVYAETGWNEGALRKALGVAH